MEPGRTFIKTDGIHLVAVEHIVSADYSSISDLRLTLTDRNGFRYALEGIEALEAAMLLNPACLEGQRLQWAKNIWAIHNLVAHPVMQVLAFARLYKLALWVHDATVPKPTGKRVSLRASQP